jgi:hypothetical protein
LIRGSSIDMGRALELNRDSGWREKEKAQLVHCQMNRTDESRNKGKNGNRSVQGLLSEAQEEIIHQQGWDNRETRAGWNFRPKVHQTPRWTGFGGYSVTDQLAFSPSPLDSPPSAKSQVTSATKRGNPCPSKKSSTTHTPTRAAVSGNPGCQPTRRKESGSRRP